jgi:hypothetical protein
MLEATSSINIKIKGNTLQLPMLNAHPGQISALPNLQLGPLGTKVIATVAVC